MRNSQVKGAPRAHEASGDDSSSEAFFIPLDTLAIPPKIQPPPSRQPFLSHNVVSSVSRALDSQPPQSIHVGRGDAKADSPLTWNALWASRLSLTSLRVLRASVFRSTFVLSCFRPFVIPKSSRKPQVAPALLRLLCFFVVHPPVRLSSSFNPHPSSQWHKNSY